MKTAIPLITAVLLGLAAVFAVNKSMKKSDSPQERTIRVVMVTSDLAAGEIIHESRIGIRAVPVSAAPKNCIDEANKAIVYNQKAVRAIVKGDYLCYTDIELDQSKGRALGDGQWGVPVTFADGVLLKMLQPGDDIAILGTFTYRDVVKTGKDANAAAQYISRNVTAVVYPRVSILSIEGSTVLLSMPPQQAVALTAIQQKVKLFPVLRKKKDDNALSRLNGGRFDDSALTDMVKGLQSIEIPLVPTEIKEVK